MNDADLRQRLEDLRELPLEAHPGVLDDVRQRIEAELEDLRRGLLSRDSPGPKS